MDNRKTDLSNNTNEMLNIKNLHASIAGKEILKGIDLEVRQGEVHAIMGPNGSGKSTLSNVLVGHPAYTVTEGSVTFRGKNLLEMAPEDRSHEGLFLSFQYLPLHVNKTRNYLFNPYMSLPFE